MPKATRELQTAYQSEWLKKRRLAWVASQGGVCVQCGGSDRVKVTFPGGRKTVPWSFGAAKREALLQGAYLLCWECSNAHAVSLRVKKPVVHGTENTYGKHGCRCEPCRAAKKACYNRNKPEGRRKQRTAEDMRQRLLGLLRQQGARLERQEKAATEAAVAVLVKRGSLRLPPPPPMPTAFDLVAELPESPACGDDIWNDLAAPLLFFLMERGPRGCTTAEASGVAKAAGMTYGMAPDAIAWLHINGMAAWRGRRWYDAAVAHLATDAPCAPEVGTWKKRGKKSKGYDAPDASDAPGATDAGDLELEGELPGPRRQLG